MEGSRKRRGQRKGGNSPRKSLRKASWADVPRVGKARRGTEA